MEELGLVYLFNLSLLAMTFTAVSALVMLIRHTLGGKLHNFDVYLITAYVSFGFAQAIAAILPPLVALFDLPAAAHWAISSGLAAIILGSALASVIQRRSKASAVATSLGVKLFFCVQGFAVFLLLLNAFGWPWQGVHIFAAALTLSVAAALWAFVRRIASLFGDKPGTDWDPKRG